MTEKKIDAPAEPASKKRFNAAETPRPVMSFRVNADLHNRMKASVEKNGYALTEEIERRLTRSFDLEERVTELEARIALAQQWQNHLWPDESARILGQGFAMALAAVRHANGQDWREDISSSLIVAGTMRRLMDRFGRGEDSLVKALAVDSARVASTADHIVETIGPYLDKAMPSLPEPAFDAAQWTGRTYLLTEFREAGTDRVLETVTGPEFDAVDPEGRPSRGANYRAVLARFAPIRETVDAEDFEVFVMRDGTHKRVSLDLTPAGPGPQPQAKALPDGLRWATHEEVAGQISIDDPTRPDSLFQASDISKIMQEPYPVPKGSDKPAPAPAEKPAPKRRRAKAPA